MSFLDLKDKTFYIAGVANKKSVAYQCGKILLEEGAKCIFSGQTPTHVESIKKLFPSSFVFLHDVRDNHHLEENFKGVVLDGFLHSLAYGNFSKGHQSFLETERDDFLEATQISSFSLVEMCRHLKSHFTPQASIVTVSISDTKATSYGYLGPIKAMLETTVCYLAKSFSEFSHIRVNSVGAGPLKTSASAGIPHYIENYLYAEELTLRKKALSTKEVANTIAYLLSPQSSGINASNIIVDAGMRSNTFDQKVVQAFSEHAMKN